MVLLSVCPIVSPSVLTGTVTCPGHLLCCSGFAELSCSCWCLLQTAGGWRPPAAGDKYRLLLDGVRIGKGGTVQVVAIMFPHWLVGWHHGGQWWILRVRGWILAWNPKPASHPGWMLRLYGLMSTNRNQELCPFTDFLWLFSTGLQISFLDHMIHTISQHVMPLYNSPQ